MPPNQVMNAEVAEVLADEIVNTAPDAPAAEAEVAEEEIEIDGQTFKSEAEALAFAKSQLQKKDHDLAVVEAYNAGLSERAPAQQAAPTAAESEAEKAMRLLGITEEEFYSDVPKALMKLSQKIRDEVKTEVMSAVNTESAEEKLWKEFHTKFPDLEDFQEDSKSALIRYDADIKALARTKGKGAAMDFLAQKTRAKFQAYAEKMKPKRELANGGNNPPPSTQTNVTKQNDAGAKKPLSFADEVRQNKMKRMS